jgi:hypothetical protein
MIPGGPGLCAATPWHFLEQCEQRGRRRIALFSVRLRLPIKQAFGVNAM